MKSAPQTLAKMTPAQKRAIKNAWQASWGEWFIPHETRIDVRRRLIQLGLLSKRPANPLRILGSMIKYRLEWSTTE